MLNDVAAIQYLYGVNSGYQTGNNTYSWTADTSIFETLGRCRWSRYSRRQQPDPGRSTQPQFRHLVANRKSLLERQGIRSRLPDHRLHHHIENATGSAYNDTLIGNAVANVLDGRAGADSMQGNGGDDIYYVDNTSDVVIENANQGMDSVYSSANFTLGNNVENLTLIGSTAINGTGNT